MLQLNKRTEYGLIALVHLVDRAGEPVSVRELSERYPVPRRLLAEVLKDLTRAHMVESHRGSQGGYTLASPPEAISLGQIITALEGAPALANCDAPAVLKQGGCDVQPTCPIRSPIQRVHEHLWELLDRTSLRSLSEDRSRRARGPAAHESPITDRATSQVSPVTPASIR